MKKLLCKALVLGTCLSMLAATSAFANRNRDRDRDRFDWQGGDSKVECMPEKESHEVDLVIRYLDNALPENRETFKIEDGDSFVKDFDVLDGYNLVNTRYRDVPEFNVDMDSKTVSLEPVEQDYEIVLEFEKKAAAVEGHNVTVITRYLDNALPEHTETYLVPHGTEFLESFEVLDGYDLYNSMFRVQPVFNVDMDTKQVSISVVETDHTITLEFDRKEYRVRLNTEYVDGAYPATTRTDWIKHEAGYQQVYQIEEGYQIINLDQLPPEVRVDEQQRTVTINSVTEDYDITLLFEKLQFNVVVRIIYQDGSRPEQVEVYTVPGGAPFETGFTIDEGYAIKTVNVNSAGVAVNRSNQLISIDAVNSPVEITITVR